MEKFKIKVKNLEYFIMKLENATVEEKIALLEIAGTLKKKVEEVDRRINVPRETLIGNEKVQGNIRK